jgi:hypothetical protein
VMLSRMWSRVRPLRKLDAERADGTGGQLLDCRHDGLAPLLPTSGGEVADRGGAGGRLTSGPGTVTASGTASTLALVPGVDARVEGPRPSCRGPSSARTGRPGGVGPYGCRTPGVSAAVRRSCAGTNGTRRPSVRPPPAVPAGGARRPARCRGTRGTRPGAPPKHG